MAVWVGEADVVIEGATNVYEQLSDRGRKVTNRFCPACGSTVCFMVEINPGLVAIPAGLFADPTVPPPTRSVFEERRHPWVAVPDGATRLPRGRDG